MFSRLLNKIILLKFNAAGIWFACRCSACTLEGAEQDFYEQLDQFEAPGSMIHLTQILIKSIIILFELNFSNTVNELNNCVENNDKEG